MATGSTTTFPSWTPKQIAIVGAVGGMIAGMMMAMLEMIYGWVAEGRSFWDAPMAIWSWVAGVEHFGDPSNHVGPIILGLGGHMMNSMMIGVGFAVLMTIIKPRDEITPIMVGVVYGLVAWIAMRYIILPLNEGEDDLFTKGGQDAVSPQWVWWLAHAVLGMVAGMYFVAVRRLRVLT